MREETHKSYQKQIKVDGIHKICILGTSDLFYEKPEARYEVSLMIEGFNEHADDHF